MNRFKFLLATLLLSATPFAAAKTIEMNVNGLVCAFCAQGIEKTLKAMPVTEGVFVSLEKHLVAVKLKDGTDIDDATLRKALKDSGYTVVDIHRTENTLDELRKRAKSSD